MTAKQISPEDKVALMIDRDHFLATFGTDREATTDLKTMLLRSALDFWWYDLKPLERAKLLMTVEGLLTFTIDRFIAFMSKVNNGEYDG